MKSIFRCVATTMFCFTAAGVATACSSTHADDRLVAPGSEQVQGLGTHNVSIGTPVTVMTVDVCTKGKPLTITRVRLDHATNLTLPDWAWIDRTDHGPLSEEFHGLPTSSAGFTRGPVVAKCTGDPAHWPGFGVTIKTTAANGRFPGFWIDSTSGTVYVHYGVALCEQTACPSGFEY